MIDRSAPAEGQAPSTAPYQPSSTEAGPPVRRGVYLGPLRLTVPVVLVALALLGSAIFVLYVTFRVQDEQIPLLGAGFGVMGASFAAIAIGTLVEMWRAASEARAGRALAMAIIGGAAGLAAIACFTFTVLGTMLWKS